jgi:hypothetical protein
VDGKHLNLTLTLERDGSAGGCRAAQLATPNTAPDIAKNITIAAHTLILVRRAIGDRVDPARDKFTAGTAGPRDVSIAGTIPVGPGETVAATCVENIFWRRATDELRGSVECKGGDTETMARGGILVGMKAMAQILVRVGVLEMKTGSTRPCRSKSFGVA